MRTELAEMSNLFAVFIKCCGKKSYMERGNRWTISPYRAILPRITGKSFVCFDSIFFVWGEILWGFSCTFLLELWTMPFFGKRFELKNKKIPICDNQIMTEGTKDMCQEWKRLLFRFDWVSEENEKLMDRRSQKISRSTPQVLCNFWSSILNKRGIDSYGFWVEIKWE